MEAPNPQEQLVGDAEDLPIGRRGLDIAALLQQAGTGAQGRPVPNYAADAASANTRVAQLLERSLRNMEQDKGYSRIGTALAADIASQGKVPYGQTVSTMEGQELGRATNVATAMAGLARSGQADELRLANLLQRRTEALAREGNMKAQRVGELVRGAAGGFDDPALASAHMYGYLARKQKENPNLDLNELPAMMNEAILDARKAGLARKRSGGGGTGGGAAVADDLKGIPLKPDNTPDFTKQIARASTEWARTWNGSSSEVREKMWQTRVSKAIGEGGTGGGVTITTTRDGEQTVTVGGKPREKEAGDLRNRELAFARTIETMDQIKEQLNTYGAGLVGPVGRAAELLGGLRAQAGALIGGLAARNEKEEENNQRLLTLIDNPTSVSSQIRLPDWLTREGTAEAALVRARFVTLAYTLASAREPGGRLTEGDIQRAMSTLGASNGDPLAIRRIFEAEEDSTLRDINRRRAALGLTDAFDPRNVAEAGRARRGPSPQEQRPQGMSDGDWQELQDLRRAQ